VATKKNAGDAHIPELLDGVTLSRTVPLRLPANFISRSHLVDSINTDAPGTTLIVGPLGYGKTSLAAEIAQKNEGRTFWYTMVDEDTAQNLILTSFKQFEMLFLALLHGLRLIFTSNQWT
jgi:predicted AAA+ superfamily ATPase